MEHTHDDGQCCECGDYRHCCCDCPRFRDKGANPDVIKGRPFAEVYPYPPDAKCDGCGHGKHNGTLCRVPDCVTYNSRGTGPCNYGALLEVR